MSDETASSEAAPEIASSESAAATTLALTGASREKADAFLDKQSRVADLQAHHLAEQSRQLRPKLWELHLGVLLRIATAFVGIAVASGLGFLIWNASQSSGLLIEPFSVPPDLAARGITGEVVAAKLLDRLQDMQAQTSSNRALKTYTNSWDQQGIKLEIPETGVSLSELDHFLRDKLGNDTHMGGEIMRTASGLNLTARAGADGAASVDGTEAELDALLQRAAEAVYRLTQPYRYAQYLDNHGRNPDAMAVFTQLAQTGPKAERTWGYFGWANDSYDSISPDKRIPLLQTAVELDPANSLAWASLGAVEYTRGNAEQALRYRLKSASVLSGKGAESIRADIRPAYRQAQQGAVDLYLGAFADASANFLRGRDGGASSTVAFRSLIADAFAGQHDLAAARTAIALPQIINGNRAYNELWRLYALMFIAVQAQDWGGVLTEAAPVAPLLQKYPSLHDLSGAMTEPLIAIAEARLGQFAQAEARVRGMPGDCYPCLRARAQIASMQKENARADYWFDLAVKAAPSIPFAYAEWGRMLMQRGDFSGAIAQFKLANQKGPHFADPLEMWGEVLIAQNRSDLALAKFSEAEKYAPNWGRLHLKWGEALSYLGKTADAQKQFARAGELDLTTAEKSELKKVAP